MKLSEKEQLYLYELETGIKNNDIDKMVEWSAFYQYNHPEIIDKKIAKEMVKYYQAGVEKGISLAALNLGAMYYSGVFIERNFKKAVELYNFAAESDDADIVVRALCNLGYCYYYGRDVSVDYGKAFNYFLQGSIIYNDPNCLYKLGDMYRLGNFVGKNEKIAFELYKQAYDNCYDDNECIVDICKRLGEFFLYGTATERNLVEAIKLLSKAESYAYEKIYKRDAFVKELLPKISELLTIAKKEFLANID